MVFDILKITTPAESSCFKYRVRVIQVMGSSCDVTYLLRQFLDVSIYPYRCFCMSFRISLFLLVEWQL